MNSWSKILLFLIVSTVTAHCITYPLKDYESYRGEIFNGDIESYLLTHVLAGTRTLSFVVQEVYSDISACHNDFLDYPFIPHIELTKCAHKRYASHTSCTNLDAFTDLVTIQITTTATEYQFGTTSDFMPDLFAAICGDVTFKSYITGTDEIYIGAKFHVVDASNVQITVIVGKTDWPFDTTYNDLYGFIVVGDGNDIKVNLGSQADASTGTLFVDGSAFGTALTTLSLSDAPKSVVYDSDRPDFSGTVYLHASYTYPELHYFPPGGKLKLPSSLSTSNSWLFEKDCSLLVGTNNDASMELCLRYPFCMFNHDTSTCIDRDTPSTNEYIDFITEITSVSTLATIGSSNTLTVTWRDEAQKTPDVYVQNEKWSVTDLSTMLIAGTVSDKSHAQFARDPRLVVISEYTIEGSDVANNFIHPNALSSDVDAIATKKELEGQFFLNAFRLNNQKYVVNFESTSTISSLSFPDVNREPMYFDSSLKLATDIAGKRLTDEGFDHFTGLNPTDIKVSGFEADYFVEKVSGVAGTYNITAVNVAATSGEQFIYNVFLDSGFDSSLMESYRDYLYSVDRGYFSFGGQYEGSAIPTFVGSADGAVPKGIFGVYHTTVPKNIFFVTNIVDALEVYVLLYDDIGNFYKIEDITQLYGDATTGYVYKVVVDDSHGYTCSHFAIYMTKGDGGVVRYPTESNLVFQSVDASCPTSPVLYHDCPTETDESACNTLVGCYYNTTMSLCLYDNVLEYDIPQPYRGTDVVYTNTSVCDVNVGSTAFLTHDVDCVFRNELNNTIQATMSMNVICSDATWSMSYTSEEDGSLDSGFYVPSAGYCLVILQVGNATFYSERHKFEFVGCPSDCLSEYERGVCDGGTCDCDTCWDGDSCSVRRVDVSKGCQGAITSYPAAKVSAGLLTAVGDVLVSGGTTVNLEFNASNVNCPVNCNDASFSYTYSTKSTNTQYFSVVGTKIGSYNAELYVSNVKLGNIEWTVVPAGADYSKTVIDCPTTVPAGDEIVCSLSFYDEFDNPTSDYEADDYSIDSDGVLLQKYSQEGDLKLKIVFENAESTDIIFKYQNTEISTKTVLVTSGTPFVATSTFAHDTSCSLAGRLCDLTGTIHDIYDNDFTGVLSLKTTCGALVGTSSVIVTNGVMDSHFRAIKDGSCSFTLSYLTSTLYSFSGAFEANMRANVSTIVTDDDGTHAVIGIILSKQPNDDVSLHVTDSLGILGFSWSAASQIITKGTDITTIPLTVWGLADSSITGDLVTRLTITTLSADTFFDGLTLAVDTTVKDNDSPDIILLCDGLNKVDGQFRVKEHIGTFTCSLTIDPAPTVDTIVHISSSDEKMTVASTATVRSAVNVEFTIIDDDYPSLGTAVTTTFITKHPTVNTNVTEVYNFFVEEDDAAGVDIATKNVFILPSERGKISLKLKAKPKATVFVFPVIEATHLQTAPSLLEIYPENWNVYHNFSIFLSTDLVLTSLEQHDISMAAYSTDNQFNQLEASLNLVIRPSTSSEFVDIATEGVVSEVGISSVIALCINTPPSGDINFLVQTNMAEYVSFSPDNVTFSPGGNLCSVVDVTALPNNKTTGDIISNVTIYSDSLDPPIEKFVDIKIIDDDSAGFIYSEPIGRPTEYGSSATFTIHLTSEPFHDVHVVIESDNTNAGRVNVSEIIFDNTNWDVPYVIAVQGQKDTLYSGDVAFQVSIRVTESDDSFYAAVQSISLSFSLQHLNWPIIDRTSVTKSHINGSDPLVIWGEHFSPGVRVYIGDSALDIVNSNTTVINGTLPPMDEIGNYAIQIVNPDTSNSLFGIADDLIPYIYYTDKCNLEGYVEVGDNCVKCPSGASCEGNVVKPNAGYYVVPGTAIVKACPLVHACTGGNVSSQCAMGYAGDMCASCEIGYFLHNSECESCSGGSLELYMTIATALIFFCSLYLLLIYGNRSFTDEIIMVLLNLQFLTGGARDILEDSDGLFKIVFTILSSFSMEYQFVQEKCNAGDFSFSTYFYGSLFIIFLLGIVPILIMLGIARAKKKENDQTQYIEWIERSIYAASVVFTSIYPNLALLCLQALNCKSFEDGLRLDADAHMMCFEGSHLLIVFFAIIIVAAVIGVPIYLVVLYNRNMKNPTAKTQRWVLRLSTFFDSFVKGKGWSIVMFFALDLLLGLIYVYVRHIEQIQFTMSLFFALIFMFFIGSASPFVKKKEHYLTLSAIFGLLVAITVHFLHSLLPSDDFSIVFLNWVVIFIIIAIIVGGIYAIAEAALQSKKKVHDHGNNGMKLRATRSFATMPIQDLDSIEVEDERHVLDDGVEVYNVGAIESDVDVEGSVDIDVSRTQSKFDSPRTLFGSNEDMDPGVMRNLQALNRYSDRISGTIDEFSDCDFDPGPHTPNSIRATDSTSKLL
ncbi:hypothetical protein PCE1_001533 [Barthelona sp. PCE]